MTPPDQPDALLETPRLTLRRFTDSDADAQLVFELDSDPEVMRYIGPFTLPDAAAYRDRIRNEWLRFYTHPNRGVLALHERATGDFLGWIFMRPAPLHRFAKEAGWTRDSDIELGYRLRKAAWGRGFTTEAAIMLVQRTLAEPDVTCVVAHTLKPNLGSIRVMEKAGLSFVREFAIPGFNDPIVMYATCRESCQPPGV